MYSVVRRYQGDPAELAELARRVGESARDVITTIPGFVSYAMADDGKGTLLSVGHFDNKTGADESTKRAAAWVRQNAADLRINPPSIFEGEARLRRVAAGVQPTYGVIRRYQVAPGAIDEIVRRAGEGFVPIITQSPGFATYTIVDGGNGAVATLTTFETQAQAENSVRLAADWVRQNLSSLVPNPPEVTSAQIKVLWRK